MEKQIDQVNLTDVDLVLEEAAPKSEIFDATTPATTVRPCERPRDATESYDNDQLFQPRKEVVLKLGTTETASTTESTGKIVVKQPAAVIQPAADKRLKRQLVATASGGHLGEVAHKYFAAADPEVCQERHGVSTHASAQRRKTRVSTAASRSVSDTPHRAPVGAGIATEPTSKKLSVATEAGGRPPGGPQRLRLTATLPTIFEEDRDRSPELH